MDLSKRAANLHNVREVRGMVGDTLVTQVVEADWLPLIRQDVTSEDDGFWSFRGEASIVEHPYTVRDAFGEFEETIAAGAFDATLRTNPPIMFNYMHDPVMTMVTTARTARDPLGGVSITADPHLSVEARVAKDDFLGQWIMPRVERGDANSMSFAFRVTRQEWNEDYTQRRITEVNLSRGDVAVIVTGLGANPAAWGTVRAAELDTDQVLAWLGSADDEARSMFAAALTPQISEPDPDAVRAWLEQTARIQERARAERDRLAGIPTV